MKSSDVTLKWLFICPPLSTNPTTTKPCVSITICYQQVATASATEWKTPAQSLRRYPTGEHTVSLKARRLGSRVETCLPTWLSCSSFHKDSSHWQGNTRLSQERFFEHQLAFSSVSLEGDLPSLVKFLIFWCFCRDGPLKTSLKKWGKEKFIAWENLQEASILSLLSEIRKPGRFIHEHARTKIPLGFNSGRCCGQRESLVQFLPPWQWGPCCLREGLCCWQLLLCFQS